MRDEVEDFLVDVPPLLSLKSSSTHDKDVTMDPVIECISCVSEWAMNLKAEDKLYKVR